MRGEGEGGRSISSFDVSSGLMTTTLPDDAHLRRLFQHGTA